MVYIVATLMRKALEKFNLLQEDADSREEVWKHLMLLPKDYSEMAIYNEVTREIMSKVEFEHGGAEYDEKYPEGIPTSVTIETTEGQSFDSDLIMYPGGHALNNNVELGTVLQHKFKMLGTLALNQQDLVKFVLKLENI